MRQANLRQILLLLLAALIWGSAFVAQSVGMDYVGPYTFLAVRNYLGFGVLAVFLALRRRGRPARAVPIPWQGCLCCGAALCIASGAQQIGIQYTTVGKAGFLTSLYVLLVPMLGLLLLRRRLPGQIWLCALVSVAGLYLLCLSGPVGFTRGDWLMLLCALGFAVQILTVDRYSPRTDPVLLACGQFLVCALLATVPSLALERPTLSALLPAWPSIAYAGVLSSGVAFTLQTVAQRNCDPTVCSLVMCLESVFSALSGWLVLGQGLTGRELMGCALMFAAIVFSQIPLPERRTAGAEG